MLHPAVEHEVDPVPTVIEGALADGFALRDSVRVEVWQEGEEYVAAAPDLLIHAFGESVDDAVANLRHEIIAHLRRLEALSDRLSPRLVAQLNQLRRLVTSVRA